MFSRKQVSMSMPSMSMSMPTTSSFTSMFSSMSWPMIALAVVGVAVMIYIAYYVYNQFVGKKTAFTPNRGETENSNKTANLLMFYVDWCPHCKTAKPEWNSLKDEYEGKQINGYNLMFTEYNCTNETEEIEQLMNKYKIEGYPTIKLLKDNQIIEYDAKPTKSTMLQFLNTVL